MPARCPICRSTLDPQGRCSNFASCSYRAPAPSWTRLFLFFVTILTGYVVLGFLFWRQYAPAFSAYLERLDGGEVYEVGVPPPAFTVRQGSRPTLTVEQLEEARRLFEQRQFELLNRFIEETQAAFEQDASREYQVRDLFEVFASPRPDYQALFDAWVEAHPERFAPYLARAAYRYQKGWESRGGDYASETSEEQFQGMREYFLAAERDLDAALAVNPRLLPAYRIRIGIRNARGEETAEDAVFERALMLFPDSYLLYSIMLWAKLPRWGGSYGEMESLARQALSHAETNPEMYTLFGAIYLDQGWKLRREKRFEEALVLFSRAIDYGENTAFFQERARTYLDLHDPERALADADRSVLLRPATADPYRIRATVRVNLKDFEGARRDIAMAGRLSPDDPDIRNWYPWASQRALRLGHDAFKEDLKQAIACYDAAIGFDPQCQGAFYWRGVAYSKTGRPKLALADCRRAVAGDPRLFEAYRMLDQLLAKERKWEEIIAYWDRYLALEPDNAEAYLERAGTYRHKGEMSKAIADLNRACELGNKEACRLYGRFR